MIENRQRNQDIPAGVPSAIPPPPPCRNCAALFSTVFSLPFGRCAACLCVHIVNTLSPWPPPAPLPGRDCHQSVPTACRVTRHAPLPVALFVSFPTSFLYPASVLPSPPCLMHNVSLPVAFVPAKNGISHRLPEL